VKPIRVTFQLFSRQVVDLSETVGSVVVLLRKTVRSIFTTRLDTKNVVAQMYEIGYQSFAVTSLTALFTGMVLALQTGFSFKKVFNEPLYVGTVVGLSLLKELGPVLTAVVVAGRVGAAIAAEIGTMKVTEQIDALETLGRSPASHLVIPRVLAGIVMIPAALAGLAFVLASQRAGKSVAVLPVTNADFTYGARIFWKPFDAYYSIIKGFAFGTCITVISCYFGFSTEQGAEGVGKSTTAAVVASCVMILLLDTLLAKLLLH